jgi:secreted PhoX family phosphatase
MTDSHGLPRRAFLAATGATLGLGLSGLGRAVHAGPGRAGATFEPRGYGPVATDPAGILDLPKGFAYSVLSSHGEEMDDGLLVPGLHDGMAAFPIDASTCLLIRNHEINTGQPPRYGPFGAENERRSKVPSHLLYDPGAGTGGPSLGGTTSILFDIREQVVRKHWLSLAGTGHNCSGGATPWNSWITCEEWTQRADATHLRDHGYAFEVPATSEIMLCEPRPLKAMGRFNREAVAVDPTTGIVYQTEDRQDSAFYRFIPNTPGRLHEGGRLEALVIADVTQFDSRNWNNDGTDSILLGQTLPVRWIELGDVESPDDDLRYRAYEAGAARFARSEGIWMGDRAMHFVCTTGGNAQLGQVFSYVPSPLEGTAGENDQPGSLTLFVEPNDQSLVNNADNLTVAANGDLFLCEDGNPCNGMACVNRDGIVERFAENRMNDSELAGACFSPDGSTLFVNIQRPGLTLAITGPWRGT